MSDELLKRKIQPRNLTARADHWVRGNSILTRPESGVDNSFPGLEFDQRNLDKRFFPGLEFEFHLGVPPLLRRVEAEAAARNIELTPEDIGQALILWSVLGTFGDPDGGPIRRVESLDNLGGLAAWRVVHDLEPGPASVFLAPFSSAGPPQLPLAEQDEVNAALRGEVDLIRRDADGILRYAVIIGTRAQYLVDGVINTGLYEPGDLTRSLCAPWQYDFADCGCFYWASNKPDIVATEPGGDQLYNFQRVRDPDQEPLSNAPGSTPEERAQLLTSRGWNADTMRHRAMIEDWESLPVVLDAEETTRFNTKIVEELPPSQVLPRAEVIQRLKYLATVEHGLMIEYLYAHYSINAPRFAPGSDANEQKLFGISKSVLGIAIDEMRHFRWVNEILRELGQSTTIARVSEFRDVDEDTRFQSHTFSLNPLSDERLQWFIDVEKPSQDVDPALADDTIDGLYTRILLSIRQSTEFSDDEREKLIHLLKLIIDEGYDHYSRFLNVQKVLGEVDSVPITRLNESPIPLPAGHPGKVAELTADNAYSVVLTTLQLVFMHNGHRTGDLLKAARFAMYAMDDAAHEVIERGGAPLFTLPDFASAGNVTGFASADPDTALREFVSNGIAEKMKEMLGRLEGEGSIETSKSMSENYRKLKQVVLETL